MLHTIKHKFDLYFDSTISVANHVINNPKTGGPVSAYLLGVGIVEFNNALQTVSIFIGLIVGGATLWVMLEKRTHDKRRRKEGAEARKREAELTNLRIQKLKLEKSALESHIKRPSK